MGIVIGAAPERKRAEYEPVIGQFVGRCRHAGYFSFSMPQQPATQVPPTPVDTPLTTVYVVTGPNTTALYHRSGCKWLLSGGTMPFTMAEAEKRYFQPHCLCINGKEGIPPCPMPRSRVSRR
jgi:hypothetical protein